MCVLSFAYAGAWAVPGDDKTGGRRFITCFIMVFYHRRQGRRGRHGAGESLIPKSLRAVPLIAKMLRPVNLITKVSCHIMCIM